MPLVSVVISAYNRPSLLKAALESVVAQTYANLELIVQDDSTNSDCERIVEQLADPRVKYTHNSPPLGTALNLLAGYRKATGRYFCTLNDDDFYAPRYVESMVNQLEADSSIAIAFSDHFIVDASGTILADRTDENTRTWKRDQLKEGVIRFTGEVALVNKSVPAMFAVFRRAAIDLNDFPEEVASGYDYWLCYLGSRAGRPIYYTPQRLTYYRIHDESQTAGFVDPSKRLSFARYSQYICRRILSDSSLSAIHPIIRSRLAYYHCAAGVALIRLGLNADAGTELRRSLRTQASISAVAALLVSALPPKLAQTALKTARP